MKRFRVLVPSPSIAVSLMALVIAAAGTGYASQLRDGGHAQAAAAKKPRKRACLSAARLCPGLRGAVDREIAAYVRAHRRQLGGARGPQGVPGVQGVGGAAGLAGPSGVGIDGIFGSGADGSQTLTGDTTLTRDMYYNDLTIAPGVTLNPGGFRVFVAGTLTLGNGARISRDGPDASGASGAAGLGSHVLGGSGDGAPNFICAGGAAPANSLGGTGGNAGGGSVMQCPGGAVTPPSANVGGPQAFDGAVQALSGRTLDGVVVSGGSGGGGTGAAPTSSGGAGGGVVVVAARSVSVGGTASITANGGNGSADGGGGGGGVAVVISTSPQPAGLTLSAAGGGASPHTGHPGFSQWFG